MGNSSVAETSAKKNDFHFVYPLGKPMLPHLLRCQGIAVENYSFTLGRLEAGAPSTFDQSGYIIGWIGLRDLAAGNRQKRIRRMR